MSSDSDNPNTESDSPNTGVLITIVAVGALAMVGISLAVTALVRYETDINESAKGATANVRPYREARAEWQKELGAGPAWTKPGQTASLPIERAMQVVVEELQRNPALATRPKAAAAAATAAPGGAQGGAAAPGAGGEAPSAAPQGSLQPAPAQAAPGSPAAAPKGKVPPGVSPPAPAPKPPPPGNAP
jgi:hypothetical protein